MKTALVIGATGLIGNEVVIQLLQSKEYSKIIVFVREKIKVENEKLEQHIIDFDKIINYKESINGNDFFCCIGTTIKKAKTKENFKKIDLTYPTIFAEIAKENGIEKFLMISSIGANPKSGNHYLKTKGLLEEKIKELNFLETIILRPSLLVGKRQKVRLGEKIGEIMLSIFSVFLIGKWKKYKSIKSSQVALAMHKLAQIKLPGIHIYESDEIQALTK